MAVSTTYPRQRTCRSQQQQHPDSQAAVYEPDGDDDGGEARGGEGESELGRRGGQLSAGISGFGDQGLGVGGRPFRLDDQDVRPQDQREHSVRL